MKTQEQFERAAYALSEDQWQLARRRKRRNAAITAITIMIPMLFVLGSAIAAAYMMAIH